MTDKPISSSPVEQGTKPFHMYVWTKRTNFHAMAQATSVDEARTLLLEEIGGGDGSCPEREAAAKIVREMQPSIFHYANAEFCLTDSAELREVEAYVETLQKKIKQLEAASVASSSPVAPAPTVDESRAVLQLQKICRAVRELEGLPVDFGLARKLSEIQRMISDMHPLPEQPRNQP